MTEKEFRELVDTYSADLSRWPVPMMKGALALIEQSPAARAYFEDALRLDDILRQYAPLPPDIGTLEEKVLSAISVPPPVEKPAPAVQWRPAWFFAPGGGLVAMAFLGFIIGSSPQQAPSPLLDPALYLQDQVISGDDLEVYTGSLF